MTDYDKRLLIYDDVAELLRVSERTVRSMVRRGDLPCVRIGRGSVRFDPADIRAFIEKRRQAGEVRR